MLDDIRQDLRYGVRSLWRTPGFTAAALVTLALGIGANAAIFSVVRAVLLEPLPFRDPGAIVRIYHASPSNGIAQGAVSEPDFLDWRAASRTAQSMGGIGMPRVFRASISRAPATRSDSRRRWSPTVSSRPSARTRSSAYAHRRRSGRRAQSRRRIQPRPVDAPIRRGSLILGRAVTLNGQPFQVVGVMPPGFTYPAEQSLDAWIPLSFFGPDDIGRSRGAHFLAVIARLKPGATESQIRAELSGVAERLSHDYADNAGWTSVTTAPIAETIVGEVRRPLIVLMVAVGMLLLIACVNIAGLVLARSSGRQTELAVRAALGAGRGRIARQLMTESLMLALLGGVLGSALALAAVQAFDAWGATELPGPGTVRLDSVVLAFCAGVSVLAGLAFGLFPAVKASRQPEASLRAGSRGAVGGTGQRVRSALVVAEVGLAVILVLGAALTAKSFARLIAVEPGFRVSDALVVTTSVPSRERYVAVLDAIRAVPGVEVAGATRDLPLQATGELWRPDIAGRATPIGGSPTVQGHHVSVDYFKAMGIPLKAGRTFTMADREDAPPVAMVNEEFARRNWPGEDAVRKRLRFGDTEVPVIGVVGNVRQGGLAEPVEPAVYLHALQQFRSRMTIVVRTSGEPLRYADTVRRAIWAQASDQTITDVTTLDAVTGRAVARPRALAWLLGGFGLIGLVLGGVGIFGVLAYAVTQRRREIGVRLALGASPRAVLQLVLGQGLLLTAAGIAIGLVGAALLTRFMASVLFGIEPSDPWTFAQVIAVLLAAPPRPAGYPHDGRWGRSGDGAA